MTTACVSRGTYRRTSGPIAVSVCRSVRPPTAALCFADSFVSNSGGLYLGGRPPLASWGGHMTALLRFIGRPSQGFLLSP